MAYTYQTGTANHLIHWFALLETFLTALGWTVVDGTGTTTVTLSSPGEGGGRTKLFIKFRRGVGALDDNVYCRVQDDLGGTHSTTEKIIETPGAGAIPFEYWMAADKDKAIVNFKAGADYTGSYVGIVEPFALAVDEEEQMVSIGLHTLGAAGTGHVLKADDGAWNQSLLSSEVTVAPDKDPLDNSISVVAVKVYEGTVNKCVGQPTDISGRIQICAGLNPEDIITTGYVGATSTWIVMGTLTHRWCMRTGGVVPVGQLEGAHLAHTNGLATSMVDFEAKLLAFMTAVGWTKIANPAPVEPIDYFWYCVGESGIDDIYLHWTYNGTTLYELTAAEDVALTHETAVQDLYITPWDFPTYYFITADRDCLLVTLERAGAFNWMWAGMYQLFLPDPDSYATPYKVGTPARILRGHGGVWNEGLGPLADGAANSSPNLYDGVTNIVWQYPVAHTTMNVLVGICKYLHYCDGPTLSLMDTVAIGGRSFRLFAQTAGTWLAMREV